MRDKVLKNPAASVRARLFSHARATGDDFQRVLTRYAIERLLFRISQTEASELYVLKGAMLFVTWPEHVVRTTGDLDLLGRGDPSPDTLRASFARICEVELPEDGILFDPATLRVEPVREEDRYQGARLSLRAGLAGANIAVQVDIGFGDYVYPAPRRQTFPTLLPGLPEAQILMYPPETVIAEKFEAMIRFGVANGRLKDFHDIWVITRTFSLELASIVEAVAGTLRHRNTAVPMEAPVALTGTFATIVAERGLWAGFLRRTSPAIQPTSFPQLQEDLRRFFDPVIASLGAPGGARGQWDHNGGAWR